jgi:hypothetical protein
MMRISLKERRSTRLRVSLYSEALEIVNPKLLFFVVKRIENSIDGFPSFFGRLTAIKDAIVAFYLIQVFSQENKRPSPVLFPLPFSLVVTMSMIVCNTPVSSNVFISTPRSLSREGTCHSSKYCTAF